jgi:hypothetical protein
MQKYLGFDDIDTYVRRNSDLYSRMAETEGLHLSLENQLVSSDETMKSRLEYLDTCRHEIHKLQEETSSAMAMQEIFYV